MLRVPEPAPIALRLRQAAKLINVSERTLWGWARGGRVPCRAMRSGSKTIYLFSRSVLERWAAGEQPQPDGPQRPEALR